MTYKKIQLSSCIVIGIIVLLCLRLWQIQIFEGTKYKNLSENNRLKVLKTPASRGIIYDRNNIPLVKNIPFFSVSIMSEKIAQIDTEGLAALIGINKEEIKKLFAKKDNSPFVPIKLKHGLSFEEIAKIESRRSDYPGLFIEVDIGREYLFGKVGAHIIGYLGKITQAQFNNPELKNFPPSAMIGQWGIEALFDDKLRGLPGEKIVEVDALGRELRVVFENPPIKGTDIELSIDIEVQKVIEEAFNNKAGALVALRPSTGEILALESLPSFDPNIFAKGITYNEWKTLLENKKKPMLNRAVQSQYPPGSIFKIITAIAALEEKIIDPSAIINCSGGISYGKWTFGCWKKEGHGAVNLHKAIVESCDVYFYEIGRRLGFDKIYKYATMFRLGMETGFKLIPIKEKHGLIPNAQWKKEKRNQQWYLGDTFISAIGQGAVSTTPIQMAVMMSAFANGGHIYKPVLIKGERIPVSSITLKQDTISRIKAALSGVVNEPTGTAKSAHLPFVEVGGKTGTAQVVSKEKNVSGEQFIDHAWFVAFAPVENSEIALSVFVEHGGGGGAVAAPIAKKVIEAYFKNSKKQPTAENGHNKNAQN